MKRLVVASVAVWALLATADGVRACGFSYACCPPPVCVSYVEKVVTAYKPVYREREVEVTVYKASYREVVRDHKCVEYVANWKDVKQVATVCKAVPTTVYKDVYRCVMVPVTCVDPCTGCAYTVCRPTTVCEKVACTVCTYVPQQVEYTARVCYYTPVERTYQTRHVVCDYVPAKEKCKQVYCELMPYQYKVCVPVYTAACCH